jgi:hypothetical protein
MPPTGSKPRTHNAERARPKSAAATTGFTSRKKEAAAASDLKMLEPCLAAEEKAVSRQGSNSGASAT